jgi:hypothetical protein
LETERAIEEAHSTKKQKQRDFAREMEQKQLLQLKVWEQQRINYLLETRAATITRSPQKRRVGTTDTT